MIIFHTHPFNQFSIIKKMNHRISTVIIAVALFSTCKNRTEKPPEEICFKLFQLRKYNRLGSNRWNYGGTWRNHSKQFQYRSNIWNRYAGWHSRVCTWKISLWII